MEAHPSKNDLSKGSPEELDKAILQILYTFFPAHAAEEALFAEEGFRYLKCTQRYSDAQMEGLIDQCKEQNSTNKLLSEEEVTVVHSLAKAFPLYSSLRDQMYDEAYEFLKETGKYDPEHLQTEISTIFQLHASSHTHFTADDMRLVQLLAKALPPYHKNRMNLQIILYEHLKAGGKYSVETIDQELNKIFTTDPTLKNKIEQNLIEMLTTVYHAYAADPTQLKHMAKIAAKHLSKTGRYTAQQIKTAIKAIFYPNKSAKESTSHLTEKDQKKVQELANAFPINSPQYSRMRTEAYLYLKDTKQYSEGEIRGAIQVLFHSPGKIQNSNAKDVDVTTQGHEASEIKEP